MEAKRLSLLIVSVLTLIVLTAFSSATLTLTGFPSTLSHTSGNFTFFATTDVVGGETVTFSVNDIAYEGKTIDFSVPAPALVTTDTPVTVTYTIESGFAFDFAEQYQTTLTATGTTSPTVTKTIPFSESEFCQFDNKGDLKVTVRNVDVTEGFGKDTDWYIFDTISVEVRVENSGDEDIDNVVVEWGLYDTKSKEWAIELDEDEDFDLDADEREDLVFTFKLDEDLDENLEDLSDGDYIFYVRATGEIADGTYEGQKTCASDSEEATLTIDDDFVMLNNFQLPESVQCNSEVQISAEAWNIGSDDQEGITVKVFNKELGIDQTVDLEDIDAFDSTDFNFAFNVPADAEEKNYPIVFTVLDEDGDVYKNDDDKKATFTETLKVQGGCFVAGATVNAVLESSAKAGRDLVVKTTVTNTGSNVETYTLNAADYSEWASAVEPATKELTLAAGQSEDVVLTFTVNRDVSGVKLFTLNVLASDKELITTQPVQVEIEDSGLLGNVFSGSKNYIWGIVALNVVLVVLIIVIAIRLSRK